MTAVKQIYTDLKDLLHSPTQPDKEGRIHSFCPTHPDGSKNNRRSLSLHPTYGLRCFAGCDWKTVATELQKHIVTTPTKAPTTLPRNDLISIHKYYDIGNTLIAEHGRFENANGDKTFKWRLPESDWKDGLQGKKLADVPLYNAQLLKEKPNETVYMVEGEKTADACIKHGLLAMTLPQGASGSLPSREQLTILTGRNVALWPDNDQAGHALMARLQGVLKPIVLSTHYVATPINLPEKGDAYDYFQLGGKPEDLNTNSVEVKTEIIAIDHVKVHMPTITGTLIFDCADIEQQKRTFDVELSVYFENNPDRAYHQRANLFSNSARNELKRDLGETFGKDEHVWPDILQTVIHKLRQAHDDINIPVDAVDIEIQNEKDLYLVDPLLPINSPTIVMGDGGSFKTFLALAVSLHVAIGREWLGADTPCLPVIYMDYEGTAQSFSMRINRLLKGMGIPEGIDGLPSQSIYRWAGRGIPFADHVKALDKAITNLGACLLVVDSVGPACGGKPEDSEIALKFFNSLSKLNITTMLLAHITKGGDTQYPFGSIYWHNESRRTWWVDRVQEENDTSLDLGFYCRKVNDGPKPSSRAIHVEFDDPIGAVSITESNINTIPEFEKNKTPRQKIFDAMQSPRTMKELNEITGLDISTISRTLRGSTDLFVENTNIKETTNGRSASKWGRLAK